ncbi:AAA family ATPase [Changpingibacter yushuensis]|uniref:AAA family ATPase n=1 Tax=Changpingibacter yushuensis TaxID=2758440 RepID=UPI002934F745|nr:AAA family ATPase [Changpingibacter yushuensis]
MDYRFATTQDREAIVGLVVDPAEAVSLRLTPFELASSPSFFRRPDASSVFRPKNSTVYSSHQLLEAENRLPDRSHDTTGPTVSLETMERIARLPDTQGRVLGEDQAEALERIAVLGRVLDVLVGPAGAGKTTAMNALRRA